MTTFPKLNTTQAALLALSAIATMVLATGCSTPSRAGAPAPVYTATGYTANGHTAAGGTGSDTETATGAAAQGQPSQPSGGTTVIPLYQEEVRVSTRQVPAGTVTLHKSVKTETFNQPIQLRHETITVNRMPAGAPGTNTQGSLAPTGRTGEQAAGDPGKTFQNQDIVIQLYREEPVVQKQLVPSGQIVAEKQAQTQQMNIQEQVRREEVQVSKSGDAKNVTVSPNLQNATQDQEKDKSTAVGAPSSDQEETSGKGTGKTPFPPADEENTP